MTERSGAVKFKGTPMTLVGEEVKVGDTAPDFTVTANDLSDLTNKDLSGKVRVISVVPSVDTPVCAVQTRTFNEKTTELSNDVKVLTVSMDLPFAQKRFCGAEGIERVDTVSDYKHRGFGEAYGVHLKELGLLARAVFVVNKNDKVVHAQYVPEVTEEPNYDVVLDAVKSAL